MPDMVIPNEGKILAVERWLAPDVYNGEDWLVRLYKNDYTPVDGSVLGNFTEATFGGYNEVTVPQANWGAGALTGNVAYSTNTTTPSYTCVLGTETVYGWYAVGDDTNKVLAAQRFDTPLPVVPGTTISLTPFKIGFKTLD